MSLITRISTMSVHQRSLADFNSVQSRLIETQQQISSGIKARDFKGLNGQVEQFVGLEAKMRKSQLLMNNNAESISRFQTQRNATAQVIEIADDMEDLMTLRRSANGGSIAFAEQMKNLRSTMTNQLNMTFNGRYLFGGTRTDMPPVIEPVPESMTAGKPDTVYYQGSQENVVLRPQENAEMEFSVRADDPAFQKIFAAISLSLKGDAEGDDAMIAQSLDLLQEGMEEVIALQARLDADIVSLNNINDQHDSTYLYLKGVTEDIAKTDVVKASTQVAVDQTILTASFQTFASVNNLRLSDYLK